MTELEIYSVYSTSELFKFKKETNLFVCLFVSNPTYTKDNCKYYSIIYTFLIQYGEIQVCYLFLCHFVSDQNRSFLPHDSNKTAGN